MSGINSRLIHDTCAISEKIKTSIYPGDYSMFLDYHVNPKFKLATDLPCSNQEKTVGCNSCDINKLATINLGPKSFVELAAIEDNLRGTTRNLTKCSNEKFISCDIYPNVSNRINGECNNNISVTPLLCDRNIVPTNLKFPLSKGF